MTSPLPTSVTSAPSNKMSDMDFAYDATPIGTTVIASSLICSCSSDGLDVDVVESELAELDLGKFEIAGIRGQNIEEI